MSDDFGIFAGSEHMFFGLDDPFAWIRAAIQDALASQVEGTVVESIVSFDAPKWRTLGRKQEDDANKIVVTAFAFCFRATVTAKSPTATEALGSTFTACFKGLGGSAKEPKSRCWLDLHDDAAGAFEDDAFENRFLEFRYT